jgi:hypothetical protein
MIFRFALVFVLAIASTLTATPLERDLGQGLGYVRLHKLPADLPAGENNRGKPCVVDIRFATGEADAAMAFSAWLKFRATARAPIFVLANRDTSPALLAALTPHEPARGIVVVGMAAGHFTPDSAVAISAADERRAFDALADGTPVEVLLAENPGKVRVDETSLTKGRGNDSPDTPSDPPAETPPVKADGPPLDLALQRAVHLHRALLALKRI